MHKKNKKYQVALPYFSKKDSVWIKSKVDDILFGRLSTGPYVEQFEKIFSKFIGTKYAVALNSCTSALEICVNFLNLDENDEVIVPAQTFIATGTAVSSQGAKVIFAEINSNTFCIDLNEIKKRITKKTKAIMLVHFAGYVPYDAIEIRNFCKKNNIFLIEDCAHSIGTKIKNISAGAIGDAGCFSFFSTKTITTGEGGMLTTNNKDLYEHAISLRERGRDWNYPTEIYNKSWRNCRITEFCAVLGINQMSNIENIIKHRNKISLIYEEYISRSQIYEFLPRKNNIRLSLWKHISLLKKNLNRDKLRKILEGKYGIIINWAYSPPLHLQPLYVDLYKNKKGMLLKTEDLMNRHFHLPLHMQISNKDAHYIGKSLLECQSLL